LISRRSHCLDKGAAFNRFQRKDAADRRGLFQPHVFDCGFLVFRG
jgi:hypothetical protein